MDAETLTRQLAVEDADLLRRVVRLRLMFPRMRAKTITARLNEGTDEASEQVPLCAVEAVLASKEFWRLYDAAVQDPQGALQAYARDAGISMRGLYVLERNMDPVLNKDKRSQNQAATARLGIAGLTPQTQVAIGPNEEFVSIVQKMLTWRNGDAKALSDGHGDAAD